jgi:hypothetical protein
MAEENFQPLENAINDDISVNTVHAENRIIVNSGGPEEYVVKFEFRPKNSSTNSVVANTHYSILSSIKQFFPDSQVYDNYGNEMKKFTALKSYDEYLRHFNLEFVKGNQDKRRTPMYVVHHRIRSNVSLGEIRKHYSVSDLLKRVNTKMTKHLWLEQETRIATLGFSINVDPTNFLKNEYEAYMLGQISERTKKSKKSIPRFQCTFSSPYDINPDTNARISTKTYALECRQKDAQELKKLLEKTYLDGAFMFFKVRHIKPELYRSAIRRQNAFLSTSRTVPLQGISEEIMFSLDNDLLQIAGVKHILRHKLTATKGRWSVMTTDSAFKHVIEVIKRDIVATVARYSDDFPMDKSFPPVGLAFKGTGQDDDDDSSGASFNSYLSSCSTIFANETTDFSGPPVTSSPAIQAWGPIPPNIPKDVQSTTTTQIVSGLSSNYNEFDREREQMAREIRELKAQVQSLLQKPQNQAPIPTGIDITAIIAATTEAVMQRMIQQQQSPNNYNNDDTPENSRDANTTMGDVNNTSVSSVEK